MSEKQCLDLLYSPMTNTISVGDVLFVRATPRQVIEWLEIYIMPLYLVMFKLDNINNWCKD